MNLKLALLGSLASLLVGCGAPVTNLSGTWLGTLTLTGVPEFQLQSISKTTDLGMSIDDGRVNEPSASLSTRIRSVTLAGCKLDEQARASGSVIALSGNCDQTPAFVGFCNNGNTGAALEGTADLSNGKVSATANIGCTNTSFVSITITGTLAR